jgi:thiosulfate dehydrogenase [quinone] large subunit
MQANQTAVDVTVSDAARSHALLRLSLGTSMLVHGLVRIGPQFWTFVEQTTKQFAPTPIPQSLVRISAMLIPPVELLIGVLLILGLWTRFALVLGGLEMCALIAGSSLLTQWEIVAIQLGYAFFFSILLRHCQSNRLSLDSWIGSRSSRRTTN